MTSELRGGRVRRFVGAAVVIAVVLVAGWWLVVPRHVRSYDGELVVDRWGEPCGTYSLVFQRSGESPRRHDLATWGVPSQRTVTDEPYLGPVVVEEWSAPLRQSPEWRAEVPGLGEVSVSGFAMVSCDRSA